MKKVLLLLFAGLFLFTCTKDELLNPLDGRLRFTLKRLSPDGTLEHYVLPDSDDFARIPQGRGNPLTSEKVALGRMLFYETGLAQDAVQEAGRGTFSCATCHVPESGFMPGRIQGIADGGAGFGFQGEGRDKAESYAEHELDVQGARPLSLLNVAYVTNSTWSGKFGAHFANTGTESVWENEAATEINHSGFDGLESQNMEGFRIHRMRTDRATFDSLGYLPFFDLAFPDWPEEERYGVKAASFAVSAYLRTLLTTEAPFQQWLRGDQEALNDQEKAGALLFYGKAGCFRCHKGAALSAVEFYAIGVKDLFEAGAYFTDENDRRNLGRGGFTGDPEDMFKFKVPGIYNMADSPFYFHGSSKRSLREVVEYFNAGIPENSRVPESQLAPQFQALTLTEQEVDELVAFLRNGLRDPNLSRYVPEGVLSGNCFPNNDPWSRDDLGCQ